MNNVIEVENLSKLYRLGLVGTKTFKEDTLRFFSKIKGKEDPYLELARTNDRENKNETDFVWSLKNLDFKVEQGDVLGVIGRNGAGKSTLLKILSRVTSPTTGSVKIKGRISSLLEVGTGFHPELTGKENIFLNGAILGMRKHEIKSKLDEIIAFAGVEKYIDTPVKRYSSGMYVRLAFAVAAHLESEILILDEVLAVGDAAFQRKCLGKMNDISKAYGKTVIFVSHNMPSVKTLCNKGIVLEYGKNVMFGDVDKCVGYYLGGDQTPNRKTFSDISVENLFALKDISVFNREYQSSYDDVINENLPIVIQTHLEIFSSEAERYNVTYHIFNELGEPLFSTDHTNFFKLKYGENTINFIIPSYFLQSGTYYLHIYFVVDKREPILIEKDIFSFTIIDSERELGVYMGKEPGYIRPSFEWNNYQI